MALVGEYEPSPSERSREQVRKFEASGGTEGNTLFDMPVIILWSRGRHSGKIRKTPLMRVEHDGKYAVVASLGGAPKHPVWYWNIHDDPDVSLQDGAQVRDYRARELSGDEYAQWWDRAVAAYPPYEDYQRKTERVIPVFVLEPR
jgi:F420H(2)-dependent quinone reductase